MCLGIQERTDGKERERRMKVKKIKRRRKRSREEKRRTKHTHKDSEILEKRRRGRKKHERRIFPLFLTKNTRKYTQRLTHCRWKKEWNHEEGFSILKEINTERDQAWGWSDSFLSWLFPSIETKEREKERERVMFGQNLQSTPGENSNSLLLLCIWCYSLCLPHVVAIYPSTHSHSSRSSSVLSLACNRSSVRIVSSLSIPSRVRLVSRCLHQVRSTEIEQQKESLLLLFTFDTKTTEGTKKWNVLIFFSVLWFPSLPSNSYILTCCCRLLSLLFLSTFSLDDVKGLQNKLCFPYLIHLHPFSRLSSPVNFPRHRQLQILKVVCLRRNKNCWRTEGFPEKTLLHLRETHYLCRAIVHHQKVC